MKVLFNISSIKHYMKSIGMDSSLIFSDSLVIDVSEMKKKRIKEKRTIKINK
jgi:hypothetical protein